MFDTAEETASEMVEVKALGTTTVRNRLMVVARNRKRPKTVAAPRVKIKSSGELKAST
jgi:hypothetical protein